MHTVVTHSLAPMKLDGVFDWQITDYHMQKKTVRIEVRTSCTSISK